MQKGMSLSYWETEYHDSELPFLLFSISHPDFLWLVPQASQNLQLEMLTPVASVLEFDISGPSFKNKWEHPSVFTGSGAEDSPFLLTRPHNNSEWVGLFASI